MFKQILQLNYHFLLIYQSFVKILKPPYQIHHKIRKSILQVILNLLKRLLKDRNQLIYLLRKLEIQTRQFLFIVRVAAIQLFPTT